MTGRPAFCFFLLLLLLSTSACTTMLATLYVPRSGQTLSGDASVGTVRYMPQQRDGLDANQVDDTGFGTVKLSEPVADFVRSALVSELRASGVKLHADAPHVLRADVESLQVNVIGFSATWRASIRLGIERREGHQLLYTGTFKAELADGSRDATAMAAFASAVVAKALQAFLAEEEVQRLLN